MNGAGAGGRLVARRTSNGVIAGRSQIGSREQRAADLEATFKSAESAAQSRRLGVRKATGSGR